MAVAAIAASIVLAKTRQAPDADELVKPGVLEDAASLESLRAAGF